MSVTFMWEIVKPDRGRSFGCGTSSDVEILRNVFGATVSDADIEKLRAMDLAAGRSKTLWGEIADTLERLSEADSVTLKIWPEY